MQKRRNEAERRYDAIVAAYLHHVEGMEISDVAWELGSSEATVKRLLKWARDTGLVTFDVHLNASHVESTEARLGHRLKPFGIRRDGIHVAPTLTSPDGRTFEQSRIPGVCSLAARFIEESCGKEPIIVVDGGRTLRECARRMAPGRLSRVTLCPFYVDPISDESSSFEVMLTLALQFPDRVRILKPPMPPVAKYRSPFLEGITNEIREMVLKADIIVLGVSAARATNQQPHSHNVLTHLGINPDTFLRKHQDVVAFFANFPLRKDGTVKRIKLLENLIPPMIDFDTLKQRSQEGKTRVVVVAAGDEKKEAVATSIRAGLPNCIVIDSRIADSLFGEFEPRST